jgi:hypothetical protein
MSFIIPATARVRSESAAPDADPSEGFSHRCYEPRSTSSRVPKPGS